jgi:hypothetical protein
MDELIERLNVSIASHRAHLESLFLKYSVGTKTDERDTGIVMGFGDVINLADALTTLQAREATLINLLRQAQASFRYTLPKFPDVEHAIDEALATSDLAKEKGSNG